MHRYVDFSSETFILHGFVSLVMAVGLFGLLSSFGATWGEFAISMILVLCLAAFLFLIQLFVIGVSRRRLGKKDRQRKGSRERA